MLSRFYLWTNRFYSTVISKSKFNNMNKCYFRYIQLEDKVDISFLLDIKGSVRQFNFSRKPTETLQVLLTRIKTNVQKAMSKGNKKKKAASEDSEDIHIELCDSNNGIINENSTCNELFSINGPVKLKMCNNIYEVIFNSPWVVSMNLPQSILAGFPVYPENLELQYANNENCKFNWYKGSILNHLGKEVNEIHVQWNLAGNKFTYTPPAQDIGMKLKLECIPGNGTTVGPAVEAISKNVIEAGPGNCPFETRHQFTKEKLKDKRVQ